MCYPKLSHPLTMITAVLLFLDEIRLLENGNVRIVVIEDRCQQRATDVAGEYEPVR
jgi:hypothetical protein